MGAGGCMRKAGGAGNKSTAGAVHHLGGGGLGDGGGGLGLHVAHGMEGGTQGDGSSRERLAACTSMLLARGCSRAQWCCMQLLHACCSVAARQLQPVHRRNSHAQAAVRQ